VIPVVCLVGPSSLVKRASRFTSLSPWLDGGRAGDGQPFNRPPIGHSLAPVVRFRPQYPTTHRAPGRGNGPPWRATRSRVSAATHHSNPANAGKLPTSLHGDIIAGNVGEKQRRECRSQMIAMRSYGEIAMMRDGGLQPGAQAFLGGGQESEGSYRACRGSRGATVRQPVRASEPGQRAFPFPACEVFPSQRSPHGVAAARTRLIRR
jgi:hypothetical protein